jgi:hypothetical protein
MPAVYIREKQHCRWLQHSAVNRILDPLVIFIFLSDKAWFTLNGKVNSRQSREVLLHFRQSLSFHEAQIAA